MRTHFLSLAVHGLWCLIRFTWTSASDGKFTATALVSQPGLQHSQPQDLTLWVTPCKISFGGQQGESWILLQVEGFFWGFQVPYLLSWFFKEMFTSHTKWFRNGNWDSDMLPNARTSGKMNILMSPMAMGQTVIYRRSSWKGDLSLKELKRCSSLHCEMFHRDFSQMPEHISCIPKPFGNPKAEALLVEVLQHFWELVRSSGSLNWLFGMCHEHHWAHDTAELSYRVMSCETWLGTPSTVLPALERCYFRQSWIYVVLMKDVPFPQLMFALLKRNPPLVAACATVFLPFRG